MQRVLVLDKNKEPLMPCQPARARQLLKAGKAAVYRRYPFTIILKEREGGDIQPIELRLDPGSKTTGISIVAQFARGWVLIWAANLTHKGQAIRKSLLDRRSLRRGRRNRKTRYRQPRWRNRNRASVKYEAGQRIVTRFSNNKQAKQGTGRPSGWIAPSLQSRVDNVFNWSRKLMGFIPISEIAVETVRFDTQKLENPEISGVEYQQGELTGYEVREYLLEKWGRKCVYCGKENVPLEIEHIVPRSRGGSSRVSNLTLACVKCNQKKGNRDVKDFLKKDPAKLKRIRSYAKQSLRDAAAVNIVRYAIGDALKALRLPVTFWSGGRTKHNRAKQGYDKDHWIDAACVGENGKQVFIRPDHSPLTIKAMGRGKRLMTRVDKFGFPCAKPKKFKRVSGFQSGDIARVVNRRGKYAGVHVGRLTVFANGRGDLRYDGLRVSVKLDDCQLIHRNDGYQYG